MASQINLGVEGHSGSRDRSPDPLALASNGAHRIVSGESEDVTGEYGDITGEVDDASGDGVTSERDSDDDMVTVGHLGYSIPTSPCFRPYNIPFHEPYPSGYYSHPTKLPIPVQVL